jgi:hypothetical protein
MLGQGWAATPSPEPLAATLRSLTFRKTNYDQPRAHIRAWGSFLWRFARYFHQLLLQLVSCTMSQRRFPPPRPVKDIGAAFVVEDSARLIHFPGRILAPLSRPRLPIVVGCSIAQAQKAERSHLLVKLDLALDLKRETDLAECYCRLCGEPLVALEFTLRQALSYYLLDLALGGHTQSLEKLADAGVENVFVHHHLRVVAAGYRPQQQTPNETPYH